MNTSSQQVVSPDQSQQILVVDDDPRLCRLLRRFLMAEGYGVEVASNGRTMMQVFGAQSIGLVILDLRLPGGEDGLSLARQLRAESDIPLIMLTGRSDNVDKIVGLEIGADDYVTKPFDRRELLARIRSVLRRASASATNNKVVGDTASVLHFSGWALNLARHELTSPDGDKVGLTSYEFQLLAALARQPAQILSRDQILEHVAHRGWQPFDRSIDVLIGKLRRKLGDDAKDPSLIKTVRGVGYLFTPMLKPHPSGPSVSD